MSNTPRACPHHRPARTGSASTVKSWWERLLDDAGAAHDRADAARASTTAACTISASTGARSSSVVYGKPGERRLRYWAAEKRAN